MNLHRWVSHLDTSWDGTALITGWLIVTSPQKGSFIYTATGSPTRANQSSLFISD
jgi:hypothetical protein